MTMCAAQLLHAMKSWSLRRALMKLEPILQAGTEELWNGNRRVDGFSWRNVRRGGPGRDGPCAEPESGIVRRFRTHDFVRSLQLHNQSSTGHEHAAVNVAEGLRVECGHVLAVVDSGASQNL